MKKNRLDEMQLAKRARIGSQSFGYLIVLLYLDVLLQQAGFHWMKYPDNVMLITAAMMAVHVVRLIRSNAFWSEAQMTSNRRIATYFATALVFGCAGALIFQRERDLASVLATVASAALAIGAIVLLIVRHRPKDED